MSSSITAGSHDHTESEQTGYRGSLQKEKATRSKASPARLAALEVVRTVRERDAYAQDILATVVDSSNLPLEERSFATKLALGVVSSQGTLDEVLNRALNKPTDIKANVRDAMRISTYEIIFLSKSSHAAVDQGVELVRQVAPKAAGLANSVLRKVVNLRNSFPFGDPRSDIEALFRLQAFPSWLGQKLVSDLGVAETLDFMRASNEPAPLYVASNEIKTTDENVRSVFEAADEIATPVILHDKQVPGCFRILDSKALLLPQIKQLFSQGKILVSDASSQMIATSLFSDSQPMSFLEIGAGRATKTILIQSASQRTWGTQIENYVTLDNHHFKTKLLKERVDRYGVKVSQALTGNACKLDQVVGETHFDVIFIDAPCSGLGTLRRHPEIRWRIQSKDFVGFAQTQLAMLKSAAQHVALGGVLAYATCTVAHEENTGVALAFLKSEEGKAYQLLPVLGKSCLATKLVTESPDAHFLVRFVRTL